jgi:hypothetical protein
LHPCDHSHSVLLTRSVLLGWPRSSKHLHTARTGLALLAGLFRHDLAGKTGLGFLVALIVAGGLNPCTCAADRSPTSPAWARRRWLWNAPGRGRKGPQMHSVSGYSSPAFSTWSCFKGKAGCRRSGESERRAWRAKSTALARTPPRQVAPAAATQARLAAARPNQRLTDGGGLRRMGGRTRRISRRDIRRDKS